jgi:hypothetical protein
MSDSTPAEQTGSKHTAGAFDVRNVIAALIGLYGVVLTIMGLVGSSGSDQVKTGGWNANLWSGLVMIVVALVFAVWTRLRPVVVDPATIDHSDDRGPAGH